MTTGNILNKIETALDDMTKGDLVDTGCRLLETLGYRSDRTLDLSGDVEEFIDTFPAPNPDTKSETRFRQKVASVRILFQITDSEIAELNRSQGQQFTVDRFDKGDAKSFVFVAVELRPGSYSRGAYIEFTREVNKRLSQPTVVLFRAAEGMVTLSFVHRRPHKLDSRRSVLGSVSLIRDIHATSPHRAHLDILSKLALQKRLSWMSDKRRPPNFDGLLAAWLDALDTEELNRSFYRQLFTWFERAIKEAEFPTNQAKTLSSEEHVIRLITRLMFVWFIKEKGLVLPELFSEEQVKSLLRDYDRDTGDSYYRAVLQNLFFATLNSEISGRRFSAKSNSDHREPSLYRFRDEIADPDRLLELFDKTPFINGGLFDCLDSFEASRDSGYRIDCFTDNVTDLRSKDFGILSIPNRLFFDDQGLISLFERFQFTVEENTPAEQEVALDPELLGKVFENLLAAYNPETRETARKQTGSYYTPREVVDFMVDEALIASLAQKCHPVDCDTELWKERLSFLLDFEDAFGDSQDLFVDSEREGLVRAIAELKLLDPAVGSGAFPMGALHKLTLALRRLDPQNNLWKSLQTEIAQRRASEAFNNDEKTERDGELKEISDTFEKYRDSDFGRKLYLIQNCIYGVDIQPVACQISKLRFFISLAIDQERDDKANNLGIKPLPNLETKFVAANTLIGLDLSIAEPLLQEDSIQQLQKKMAANREKYFLPSSRRKKIGYIREGENLSAQLKHELEDKRLAWEESQRREMDRKIALIPSPENALKLKNELMERYRVEKKEFLSGLANAYKIASWTPFDQNASANWFDSKYMFGVTEGFDVVIGNPPYVSHDKIPKDLKAQLELDYRSYQSFADVSCYFIEKAVELQNVKGALSFVTSNSYLRAEYGEPIRELLSSETTLHKVISIEDSQVFENVIVNVAVIVTCKSSDNATRPCTVVNSPFSGERFVAYVNSNSFEIPQSNFDGSPWNLVEPELSELQRKLELSGDTLEQQRVKIRLGVATGSNEAFLIDEAKKRELCRKNPKNAEIIKPILRGKDIFRYSYSLSGEQILLTRNGVNVERDYPDIYDHFDSFGSKFRNRGAQGQHWTNLRACSFYDDFKKEQIVWIELADIGRFALCAEEVYLLNSAYFLLPPDGMDSRFLLGILNSSTIRFYLKLIAVTSGMGVSRWIKNYVKEFPIPEVADEEKVTLIGIVKRILSEKQGDPFADTSALEVQIDQLVYKLYGLTDEEIAVVEGHS
ncbi:MAG: N-6 DNA methylase [Caldilineaceae bacterium SB0664_bin_27]|uniref:site-specific DNA-methyltransferase (adenine-specific) n=1 Tax=Caldilineaceae bacterium SB0664_bin_27 TaxID=2605260 RepID=A0A6B0YQ12_9CHLR|nr:N-6 DNA methylase [Caldilineaceae bacterium SB0664_bin_27]